MKSSANVSKIINYFLQHWFKLTFLTLVLYLFIQKEFSFSLNLNSPQEESIEVSPSKYGPAVTPKKEIFTERKKEPPKNVDKFQMPFIFGSSSKYNPITALKQIDDKTKHDYLKRFARVVINERRKYGIPSSIILASGLLQSQAGQRDMSKQGNNHFGLTCSLNWGGESEIYDGACYRHYENAWTSFRDNSIYLTSGKFAQLSTLESTDFQAWAKGLEQLNYGDIDNLAKHLIEIIQRYGLDELDRR